MARGYLSLCAIILWLCCGYGSAGKVEPFDDNYIADWGQQQFTYLNDRTQVQIQIDESSGGGFRSKDAYGSGYFQISLKIPKNTTGIATTFYDYAQAGNHDELDFELLGVRGSRYVLSTNVFAQDNGHREQQFNLWFDPSSDFHDYAILWNPKQIVFYVDKIPVRVFKNNTQNGANYPKLPMYIHGSLWNASQWLGPTDWSKGPFYASYRGFGVRYGCSTTAKPNPQQDCASLRYPWNNWQLSAKEEKMYELIKKRYIVYDYCKSGSGKNFPECHIA
ncbi:putative xyloglucan endotransglucosylase/hydrolase protein 1 [Phtheirospermum japonicum]|uniref:Putative xyloglucan endotransglucosylase/hydrolase protein 1 n=1 Tax=Phtheirospermum japonicum TaxID=374723 RepID=A0A830CSN7_9LAMI|nr:putative xyloglucan endotransglucosylase/hydrolase protein 1 [Phtheirospermum japonicum]